MLVEKIAPPRRERGPAARLLATMRAMAGGHASIVSHHESAWASITFSGTRHTIHLAFDGCEATEAGERLIAELPDHEFAIPGHLVADAVVTEVDHRLLPDERLEVRIEVLMLADD